MPPPDEKKEPLTGEVLPPEDGAQSLANGLPDRGGIPLFNRMRYNAIRKEMEAYTAALRAANEGRRELLTAAKIAEECDTQLTRLDNLDAIRATAVREIEYELRQADKKLSDLAGREHIDALVLRLETARLEAEIIEAEARLERLKNPPPAEPRVSAFDQMMAEMARVRGDEKRLREAIIKEAGGEENLSEEDRVLLEQLAIVTRDRIARLMEGLAG